MAEHKSAYDNIYSSAVNACLSTRSIFKLLPHVDDGRLQDLSAVLLSYRYSLTKDRIGMTLLASSDKTLYGAVHIKVSLGFCSIICNPSRIISELDEDETFGTAFVGPY
jgi:hypothetical protein